MAFKMGACKGCAERRKSLAKIPAYVKKQAAKIVAKQEKKK